MHAFCGVGAESDDAEYEKQHATCDLQPENVLRSVDEIHDERHAKTGDDSIEKVARGGAGTGDQTIVAPLVDGALQAKYACRSHRCGDDDADNQTFKHQLECTLELGPNVDELGLYNEGVHTICINDMDMAHGFAAEGGGKCRGFASEVRNFRCESAVLFEVKCGSFCSEERKAVRG